MRLRRNLRLSFRALATHRLRTALAMLGAAIGVGGVLVLTAVGTGARTAVLRRIESLGRNMLVVSAATLEARGGRTFAGNDRTRSLRRDDALAVLRGSAAVRRVAPSQDRGMAAKFGPIQTPATVVATTPEWQHIRQFPLASGRFFTEEENLRRAQVAVIGSVVRANLFPDSVNPIGRTIRLGAVPVEVIGVLISKGISVDGNATEDDRIYVPLETGLRRLFRLDYLKQIYIEAADAPALTIAQEDANAILRDRHALRAGEPDDFQIQNQWIILAADLATQTAFQRLIMGLAFLALIVGGVGILSIMLLSVRERRHEIGLRVAIGARRPDIVIQFLAEALMLAAAGGCIGMLLGTGVAAILSSVTSWEARITTVPVTFAVGSIVGIGVVFGVFPAWRAARLDPIEALRAE